jgi:hypothetical protein
LSLRHSVKTYSERFHANRLKRKQIKTNKLGRVFPLKLLK